MKHQILIASYRKDFEFLFWNLKSIAKFGTGFLCPVIAVTEEDRDAAEDVTKRAKIGVVKIWQGPGFGRAQDAMMNGDTLCPEADYYWLLGSDCFATASFSPADFCGADGKPIMLWATWEHMQRYASPAMVWKAGVEKAFGWDSQGEFMRRLPLAYPTKMLSPMREFIAKRHNTSFQAYVWHEVNRTRNFSESNVMGEWAWRHAQDAYNWINIEQRPQPWPVNPVLQFWSHGGMDRVTYNGKSPRQVIKESGV